jgi:erythromycin esterase-like protein
MWRNTDVVDFVEWLRQHNDALAPSAPKTGFYGLDLYSLNASMEAEALSANRTTSARQKGHASGRHCNGELCMLTPACA